MPYQSEASSGLRYQSILGGRHVSIPIRVEPTNGTSWASLCNRQSFLLFVTSFSEPLNVTTTWRSSQPPAYCHWLGPVPPGRTGCSRSCFAHLQKLINKKIILIIGSSFILLPKQCTYSPQILPCLASRRFRRPPVCCSRNGAPGHHQRKSFISSFVAGGRS